jgi:hypothetical protein
LDHRQVTIMARRIAFHQLLQTLDGLRILGLCSTWDMGDMGKNHENM